LYLDLGPYSRIGDWVRTGIDRIGADRILFGTDYGVNGGTRGDVSTSIKTLESVLTPAERQLIFVDNSRALLKAHGRS
jgi:predicted TIM-barrel fold metal-dependent hydrolase